MNDHAPTVGATHASPPPICVEAPVRLDLAGGWTDVPPFVVDDGQAVGVGILGETDGGGFGFGALGEFGEILPGWFGGVGELPGGLAVKVDQVAAKSPVSSVCC